MQEGRYRFTGRARETEQGGGGPRERQVIGPDGTNLGYAEEGSMLWDKAEAAITPAERDAAKRRRITYWLRTYYGQEVSRQQAGDLTWLEARLAKLELREGGQAYRDIAEEIDPKDSTALTLDQLDQRAVRLAERWARRNHQKWPPKPTTSGWQFQVIHIPGTPRDKDYRLE